MARFLVSMMATPQNYEPVQDTRPRLSGPGSTLAVWGAGEALGGGFVRVGVVRFGGCWGWYNGAISIGLNVFFECYIPAARAPGVVADYWRHVVSVLVVV